MPKAKYFNKLLILLIFLGNFLAGKAAFAADPRPGECPQSRPTVRAPADYLSRTNPLPASPEVLVYRFRLSRHAFATQAAFRMA